MTRPAAEDDSLAERAALERLRTSYEQLGYDFVVRPGAGDLPAFMAGYLPDAVAKAGNMHVAIEIRGARGASASDSLARITRLFEGHPEWSLMVHFAEDDAVVVPPLPTKSIDDLRTQAGNIRRMVADGYLTAGLVMAFSLLEAVARLTRDDQASPPLKPGTVVQTLAMDGLISSDQAIHLRGLASIRNRIVHGDVAAHVSAADVDAVLLAMESALTGAFAR